MVLLKKKSIEFTIRHGFSLLQSIAFDEKEMRFNPFLACYQFFSRKKTFLRKYNVKYNVTLTSACAYQYIFVLNNTLRLLFFFVAGWIPLLFTLYSHCLVGFVSLFLNLQYDGRIPLNVLGLFFTALWNRSHFLYKNFLISFEDSCPNI